MAFMTFTKLSRRSFLATMAALPMALKSAAAAAGAIPVGLELYSVREALKKDPEGTIRAVAAMGYQAVEFYAPYFEWTEAQAKQTRKLLDELGMRCYSTHNDQEYLSRKNMPHTRDLNLILGSKYVVLAHWEPKTKNDPDGWRPLADELNSAAEQLEPAGLKVGYHNHQAEFSVTVGHRPMDVIAKNTKSTVMLQLDVGTCLEAGGDPVTWIRANPGRIRSIHCKEWSPAPEKGYKVLLGEGVADWKGIFQAAETVGGVEYYLVEQEGSRFSELETARRCLQAFRARHTGR
jgi:sugar phosphate isomerase/epimerase